MACDTSKVGLVLFVLASATIEHSSADDAINKRMQRQFSVFQIIQFPNDACFGDGKNGTCYTESECSSRGGANAGSCAGGFGVCCVKTVTCGGSSSENCTYFESSGSGLASSGGCAATVCPCSQNICQLRLDFLTFSVTGPSTLSTPPTGGLNNGVIAATTAGPLVCTSGQCLTDSFAVTNPGGNVPPVICGTNTGEHMYVDSSPSCNVLAFQLGSAGVGVSVTSRRWSIKVTQYSCDFNNLAPQGCTQYYFGATSNSFQSYNYQGGGGQHLANQDQVVCVRRENQYCRICFYQEEIGDFAISGPQATAPLLGSGYNMDSFCCGYSATSASANTKGFDCVLIPGASAAAIAGNMVNSRYCGRSAGLVSATGNGRNSASICTSQTPFRIEFRSDAYEYLGTDRGVAFGEAASPDPGFVLSYTMDAGCGQAQNQG